MEFAGVARGFSLYIGGTLGSLRQHFSMTSRNATNSSIGAHGPRKSTSAVPSIFRCHFAVIIKQHIVVAFLYFGGAQRFA